MAIMFVRFDITKSFNGLQTFKCLDFDLEVSVKEKDNSKLYRFVTRKVTQYLIEKNLSIEALKQYMTIPISIKNGVFIIPIRIADILDSKVEKVTISMPSDLVARIDEYVTKHPEHASRSSLLADAALNLMLEDSNFNLGADKHENR